MRDSSSQLFLATVVLIMLSFSIFTYNYVPASFAYDNRRFGDNNDDNHSGDGSTHDRDNRRLSHSGESNSEHDNWRDHDHSDDTNSGEGKATDSMGQASDSYGAPSDDTQSGESSSTSDNLAANSDSGSEISDPINPIENSATESGSADTPESNGSSRTDNSTSQSNTYLASDPGGLVEQSNSELLNQSASSGTSQEPALSNQRSTEGNSIANQSSTTASSSSEGNGSSVGSLSATGSQDMLGGFIRSSDQSQMAIPSLKTTISVVNYGDVGKTDDASATISLDKSSYTTQDSPKINILDPDANVDANSINTVHVNVTSTTDKTGIPITLVETGPDTGIFEGRFLFTTGTSSITSIQIASDDDVRISYVGTDGIIFDSVAPVTSSSPPIDNPPPINNLPPATTSDSTNTPVVIATILSSPTSGASLRALNTTSHTASIISTTLETSSVTARSGNKTITVPEEGNVTFSYTSLLSQGELTALPMKTTSELAAINITEGANHKPGKLMALDNTHYIPVGTVFIIAPTDARFNGTITVVIPYNMTLASQQTGQEVKLLHYTGSTWEDVTTFPHANGHLVTGSLSTTLGPVVAAVKSE
jgi:hypothetical protein